MAQSTILAAGTTVTTSSTVAVPPGGSVTLGLFVASGDIPNNVSAIVQVTTPGAAVNIGSLSKQTPTFLVPGPCTVQVLRQEAGGASVGVYAESAIGQPVEGSVAHGGTESSVNPVLIGGLDRNSVTLRRMAVGTFGDVYIEGGGTVSKLASAAASNNATNMKSSNGKIFAVQGFKATAGACWVKFYNKASAPTVGTDLPFISLYCPASSPFLFTYPGGIQFGTGIGYAIVTGASETDNTAVAAGDILNLNILYT